MLLTGEDRKIRLWDLASGELIKELKAALRELFLMPAEEHSVLTMPPSADTDRLMYGYTEVFGERVYSLAGKKQHGHRQKSISDDIRDKS